MTLPNNWDLIPKNDLSANARSGTELMLERLYDGTIERELLEQFEIIPSRFRPDKLDPNKKWVWWEHNLAQDPESARLADPDFRKQFASIVFVSNWQMQQFSMVHGIPYSECTVIENAITPINKYPVAAVQYEQLQKNKQPIKLIYHTTPHRGLGLLIPVFNEVKKVIPNITLDVYSSFKLYGWPQRDQQFEGLFKLGRNSPGITMHESVPNETIREVLNEMHIFAYPSIWQETSCLAGIEAASAGLLTVAPNLGALPETLGKFPSTLMYQWTEDHQQHANRFAHALMSAIFMIQQPDPTDAASRSQMTQLLVRNGQNNWANCCQTWGRHLRSIL